MKKASDGKNKLEYKGKNGNKFSASVQSYSEKKLQNKEKENTDDPRRFK